MKVACFIDGANIYSTAKTLGFDIDYKGLLRYCLGDIEDNESIRPKATFVRAYYYAVTKTEEVDSFNAMQPLIDWLSYNGYSVSVREAKEFINKEGARRYKTNIDSELCVDAMEVAEHFDEIMLFSGNSDLVPLVKALQRKGKKVIVISTIQTQPHMASDELRRSADQFIDMAEIQEYCLREKKSTREDGRLPNFVTKNEDSVITGNDID